MSTKRGTPGTTHRGPGGRDPSRVERISEKLAHAWATVPDQRLGQFVVNLARKPDPFYVEDDALEAALDAFLASGGFAS